MVLTNGYTCVQFCNHYLIAAVEALSLCAFIRGQSFI